MGVVFAPRIMEVETGPQNMGERVTWIVFLWLHTVFVFVCVFVGSIFFFGKS